LQLANSPAKIVEAFAVNGSKNTVPVPSQAGITPGAASYNDGFPILCDTPVNEGGIPPSMQDMNGILNEATAISQWLNAGGVFTFDATFAAAVGGYPSGAQILQASGGGYWRSVIDNNSNNPDTGGSGWVATGGAVTPPAFSSVYAAAQQTLAVGSSKVLFNTVEFDTGLWSGVNQRFVANLAGFYRISGSVMLEAPGGQLLATLVYKNGALLKQCFQAPQVSTGNLSLPFDALVQCAIGDYLEVFLNVPLTPVLAGQAGSNQAYVFAQAEYAGS
jgi:hypothetical protein